MRLFGVILHEVDDVRHEGPIDVRVYLTVIRRRTVLTTRRWLVKEIDCQAYECVDGMVEYTMLGVPSVALWIPPIPW